MLHFLEDVPDDIHMVLCGLDRVDCPLWLVFLNIDYGFLDLHIKVIEEFCCLIQSETHHQADKHCKDFA